MARSMKARYVFLLLFSLPFAAVGIGMSLWLLSGIVGHWKTQSWKETPAKIVRAKLETHTDPESGNSYQATAEYTYQFGGRQYTSNRVSIQGGSNNIGSYQQDIHRQLRRIRRRAAPSAATSIPTGRARRFSSAISAGRWSAL